LAINLGTDAANSDHPSSLNLRRIAMAVATVLCIDDNPQLLEFRKATLEPYGYHVEIALSGHAAIKMLEKASVAAVLLEYKLEGIDAEAVACHIKQRFPNLPIIGGRH
jgi:CheY-like chemotaxis protein